MYNYDGRRKRIMKSIIEEYATDQPDTYSIQLFYDVDDLEHFGKCEVIYSGESTTFGPWQNYSLKNTANTLEEIWMCTVNTFFSNGSEKWYLVRYLTTYHAPLQPKDPDHVSDTKRKSFHR